MKRALVLLLILLALPAFGATYYVDATNGLDANSGTSTTAPWKTLSKVGSATLAAGDTVLFKRGEIWYEGLTSTESGTAGNLITFGAYGSGDPPTFDGGVPHNSATDWTSDGTVANVWYHAAAVDYGIEFDGIRGVYQSAKASVTSPYDYAYDGTNVYVFSAGNPANTYQDIRHWEVYRMLFMSGDYNTVEHIRILRPGYIGIYFSGDHFTAQYCEIWWTNSGVTAASTYGIYASSAADYGAVYNCTLNGAGAQGITWEGTNGSVKNNVVVGSTIYALRITATGTLTYANNYFAGNSVGVSTGFAQPQIYVTAGGTGTDGGGNVLPWPETGGADAPNGMQDFQGWPYIVRANIQSDDSSDTYETWLTDVVAQFNSRGIVPFTQYSICGNSASAMAALYATWFGQGHEIESHGWSHAYYTTDFDGTDDPGIKVQYVGAGTTATIALASYILSTSIDGTADISVNLHAAAYDTADELCDYIAARDKDVDGTVDYTCSRDPDGDGTLEASAIVHTVGLTSFTAQDIKSTASYTMRWTKATTIRDELRTCANWLRTNVSGKSAKIIHCWPGGERDATADGYLDDEGIYHCAKGAGVESDWHLGIQNGKCIYRVYFNDVDGDTTAQINSQIASQVLFSAAHMGRPMVLYTHPQDGLSAAEVGATLDAVVAAGATYSSMVQIADDIYAAPKRGAMDNRRGAKYFSLRPAYGSPMVNTGATITGITTTDIMGQTVVGTPDMGAYEYLPRNVGVR